MTELGKNAGCAVGTMTLSAVVAQTTEALARAHLDNPRDEARRLVLMVLGWDGATLIASPEKPLSSDQVSAVQSAAAERTTHRPLSRIVGHRAFYGRTFKLGAETLDPRPDTETLIELALECLPPPRSLNDAPLRFLDVGTGSGCLAVTLACERPDLVGTATDISMPACRIAAHNARTHGVSDRVDIICTNGVDGLSGSFDIIVSNPPYIPSLEIATLQPEVKDHDPHAALNGGIDGLAFYHAWIPQFVSLARQGVVLVEVGAGQADDVANVFRAAGAYNIVQKMDLAGHVRCVGNAPVNQG